MHFSGITLWYGWMHGRSAGPARVGERASERGAHLRSNAEGQQAIYGNNGSARGPKIGILRKGIIIPCEGAMSVCGGTFTPIYLR